MVYKIYFADQQYLKIQEIRKHKILWSIDEVDTICCIYLDVIKMRCPYCLSDETKVVDKRDSDSTTRRRRECLNCEKRFTTHERVENANITIIKKDGNRESYDRDKVKIGIQKACEKRPVTAEQIDEALDVIETELRAMGSTEIPSKKVGMLIMKMLRKLDKVAYIRFASVYKDFKDVEEFEEELKKLLKR